MNGTFGITYEQLQPKLFLSAGHSATKHGPNIFYPKSVEIFSILGLTVLMEKITWFFSVVERSSGQFSALETIVVLVIS
jgi:hypothetical protein